MPEKTKKEEEKKEVKSKAKLKTKSLFAVIETGGKQYIVKEGLEVKIEKVKQPIKGNSVIFDKVLLVDDGESTEIGTPYIEGKKIEAEFIEEGRAKKITVLKYKRKTRYKVKRGHRQPYTKIKIKSL